MSAPGASIASSGRRTKVSVREAAQLSINVDAQLSSVEQHLSDNVITQIGHPNEP